MGTITKAPVGVEDLSLKNSGTTRQTFTRLDSEGRTITLNQIDAADLQFRTAALSLDDLVDGGFDVVLKVLTPWIKTSINDENGNEVIGLTATGSAVNEVTIKNAATGNNPVIAATGEADTGITIENDQGEEILILDAVATAVNEVKISNAATGVGPTVAAQGETNVDLLLTAAGTGVVKADGSEVLTVTEKGSLWPSFSVHKDGTQQDNVGTSLEIITWSTEVFDTNNDFTNNRFTPTVPGKYLFNISVRWAQDAPGDGMIISILKNGVITSSNFHFAPASQFTMFFSTILDANGTTDYFEVHGADITTAASVIGTAVYTFFTGCRIG